MEASLSLTPKVKTVKGKGLLITLEELNFCMLKCYKENKKANGKLKKSIVNYKQIKFPYYKKRAYKAIR